MDGSLALQQAQAGLILGGGRSGVSAEARLVAEAQRGAPDAVEALVRTHWGKAYAVAFGIVGNSATAEDIAQEAMLAGIRGLAGFDRSRPFGPWLHRIVVNKAIDWVRPAFRRSELPLTELGSEETVQLDSTLGDDLAVALAALEPSDRAIVVLRHVGGFSSIEIGSMLEMPDATVRSKLARSLAVLRSQLGTGAAASERRTQASG